MTDSNDARKDLFPGALEMMILQTLRRQSLHGYALVQHIQRTSNDLLRVEEGSLYPALQRLLKAGCVEARWEMSERGRRVRRYELTVEGARRLDREVSSFEQMLQGIRLVLSPNEP
jgi:PadR family transcriptional regulator, regulatory protein PadR